MSRPSADAALVRPAARAAGRVRVPGDKSISHRYAMLAALADGTSILRGYSPGADCASTLACLEKLGVSILRRPDGSIDIEGRGVGGLGAPAGPLDAGNSGTTMRLLAGIVAAHHFRTTIVGDASLARRPMRRVIEPLVRMGASISARDGRPPLVIDGAALQGITYRPDVPSAQIKSAVLLAGIQAAGDTHVIEPAATRDHTERALVAFGASVAREGTRISVSGGQRLEARDLAIPGDLSSATFWMALAAGTPGSAVEIEDLGLNPSRTAVVDVIRRAGARIDVTDVTESAGEPLGRVRVSSGTAEPLRIEPDEVPGLIDEIPALAAMVALGPEGREFHVSGASELRVKESDRITALADGFRAMGAHVEEFEDGFRLVSRPLKGAILDAAGDHRLAMAFAIAATAATGPVTITGASAVAVSYPGFFDELERLTGHR